MGEQAKEQDFLGFLSDWFTGYVADRRRNPRDDVLTQMATATFPDGSMPEVVDVVRVATLLFAGGQGTAVRFVDNAMKYLAEQPDLQQRLREDPAQVPQFLEEMLRFNSPVKVNFRMARANTTRAGIDVPAGSTLILLLGAADRDAGRFGCPAELDLQRDNARDHVAFGRGAHSCPAGPLVRTESHITVVRMLSRLRDIRISDSHHGPASARRFDYTELHSARHREPSPRLLLCCVKLGHYLDSVAVPRGQARTGGARIARDSRISVLPT